MDIQKVGDKFILPQPPKEMTLEEVNELLKSYRNEQENNYQEYLKSKTLGDELEDVIKKYDTRPVTTSFSGI